MVPFLFAFKKKKKNGTNEAKRSLTFVKSLVKETVSSHVHSAGHPSGVPLLEGSMASFSHQQNIDTLGMNS